MKSLLIGLALVSGLGFWGGFIYLAATSDSEHADNRTHCERVEGQAYLNYRKYVKTSEMAKQLASNDKANCIEQQQNK